MLELIGFSRINEWPQTDDRYIKYKKEHGGVDPFGPSGQPHFEIDFVVSIPLRILKFHSSLTTSTFLVSICGCFPVALPSFPRG